MARYVDVFIAMSEFSRAEHAEFGFPYEMEVLTYLRPGDDRTTGRRTPVPARRVGPLPEIVEKARGGLLFETPDELLEGMRRLVRDPEERSRLAGSAHAAHAAHRDHGSESAVVPECLKIVRRAVDLRNRDEGVDVSVAASELVGASS